MENIEKASNLDVNNELEYGKDCFPNIRENLQNIAFSKGMRRMADKTQMFSTDIGDHYRTRLTHTIEVVQVSKELCKRIKDFLEKNNFHDECDESLVECIAYSHDIGHTPFGHQGEQSINALMYEYTKGTNKPRFFKHNANSFRILLEQSIEEKGIVYYDWKVLDGVLKHTSVFPKKNHDLQNKEINVDMKMIEDPYGFSSDFDKFPILKTDERKTSFKKKLINFLMEIYPNINNKEGKFIDKYFDYPFPLSLEGMIVRIADEIAQRVSDLDDTLRLIKRERINNSINMENNYYQKLYDMIDELYKEKKVFSESDLKYVNTLKECIISFINQLNSESFETEKYEDIQHNIRDLTAEYFIQSVIDNLYYVISNKENIIVIDKKNYIKHYVVKLQNKDKNYDVVVQRLYYPLKINDVLQPLINFNNNCLKIDKVLSDYNFDNIINGEIIKKSNDFGHETIIKMFDYIVKNPIVLSEKIKSQIYQEICWFYNQTIYTRKKIKKKEMLKIVSLECKTKFNCMIKLLEKQEFTNEFFRTSIFYYLLMNKNTFKENNNNDKNYFDNKAFIENIGLIFLKNVLYHIASMTNHYIEDYFSEIKNLMELKEKYHM